jgi:nitrogen regulatory protein PII 1
MKMIRAVLRPKKTDEVVEALAEGGFVALTKINVAGRGKQKGVKVGDVYYDELPKTMLLMVVNDKDVEKAIGIISKTSYTGNPGDGKIFVTPVEKTYTIRTGSEEL